MDKYKRGLRTYVLGLGSALKEVWSVSGLLFSSHRNTLRTFCFLRAVWWLLECNRLLITTHNQAVSIAPLWDLTANWGDSDLEGREEHSRHEHQHESHEALKNGLGMQKGACFCWFVFIYFCFLFFFSLFLCVCMCVQQSVCAHGWFSHFRCLVVQRSLLVSLCESSFPSDVGHVTQAETGRTSSDVDASS